MITVKNISSALVVLMLPDLHFRRELMPGREIPIKQEEYEAMTFDPGIMNMLQDHYIRFNGITEEEQPVTINNDEVYEAANIKKMLEEQDITNFAKFIPTAAPAEKDAVVKYATDLGITNGGFVTLIKKYCDVDIINAINTQHQLNS